jgi:hypothetical protein
MSYYDNLRGVLQTKLDALNRMDEFHDIARAIKKGSPSSANASGLGKAAGWGLAVAGVAVALAVKAAVSEKQSK